MISVTQDIILKDKLWINQSKIKRLTSTIICPRKYYMEEFVKEITDDNGEIKQLRETTESMNRGCYFEYHIWGTLPKDGKIPIASKGKKKGSKSEIYKRIDEQIKNFPVIMAKYGIKVIKTNVTIEAQVAPDTIIFGTIDALVEWKGRVYIMDLKLTADVNSEYGDFNWGCFKNRRNDGVYVADYDPFDSEAMDTIQAHTYMYIMELRTKMRCGFIYAVFDYKKGQLGHKIIEVPFSETARESLLERVSKTRQKLDGFAESGYAPIPTWTECKTCRVPDCPVRIPVDPWDKFECQASPLFLPAGILDPYDGNPNEPADTELAVVLFDDLVDGSGGLGIEDPFEDPFSFD